MGAGAFSWTDEAVTIATDLWPHETAEFIASLLGCTRNTVIGKMHRLGAEKQRTVAKPGRAPRAAKPRAPARPKTVCVRAPVKEAPVAPLPEAVEIEAIEATPSEPVTFANLRSHHCRWVLDRADGLDTLFCGDAAVGTHAWCAHHLGVVYPSLANRS